MKKLVVLLFAGTIAFSSCKKEAPVITGQSQPAQPEKRLKQASQLNADGSTEFDYFMYDAEGKLKEWRTQSFLFLFDYHTAGKLFVSKTNIQSGTIEMKYDCGLNSKGLVTKVEVKYPDGTLYGTYAYFYNADDYVTGYAYVPVSGSGFSVQYTLINGNITGHKQTNAASGKTYTATYSYLDGTRNTHNYTHAGYFPGNLFGKTSRNLIAVYHVKNEDGSTSFRADHTYELDGSGFLKKERIDYPMNGYWNEINYNFE